MWSFERYFAETEKLKQPESSKKVDTKPERSKKKRQPKVDSKARREGRLKKKRQSKKKRRAKDSSESRREVQTKKKRQGHYNGGKIEWWRQAATKRNRRLPVVSIRL